MTCVFMICGILLLLVLFKVVLGYTKFKSSDDGKVLLWFNDMHTIILKASGLLLRLWITAENRLSQIYHNSPKKRVTNHLYDL